MFQGFLVGLLGKQVQVKGRVILKKTFGAETITKTIKVKYLMVDGLSPYNTALGMSDLNLEGTVLLTFILSLKYILPNGRVRLACADPEAS